jgi:DNA polymerase V
MGNIKIIRGVFDTKLELQHAGVKAGFPSPAEDYIHETLDFNRDYIRHSEASFYGDIEGDSMKDAGIFDGDRVIVDRINRMNGSETIVIGAQQYTQKNGKGKAEVFANAIKHDFKSKNPTTRWADVIKLH